MRKFQKAAVVVAMLGSVSFLGAGVAQAGGEKDIDFKVDNHQAQQCGNRDVDALVNVSDIKLPVSLLSNVPDQNLSDNVHCVESFAFGK